MRKIHAFVAAGAIVATAGTGVVTSSVSASPASGSQPARHGRVFHSTLVGRPIDPSLDVAIRGVAPGGVPWTLDRGATAINANGRLVLKLDGLLITGTNSDLDGTTGPVTAVVASLTCDGTTPTIVSTVSVPLSPGGDAAINQQVTLPATCVAPIVLVRANSSSGPWIAASGF